MASMGKSKRQIDPQSESWITANILDLYATIDIPETEEQILHVSSLPHHLRM
jgi:hypothetical protein